MSGIVLSSSVRQNLLSLQSTADLLATTQNRLATGKKVNTALDNPTNFFTAQSLDSRAGDINNLLDGIGNGVQVLQAANTGITSLQKLVDTAKSIANQALQSAVGYSTKSNVSATITGATATDLRGTTSYTSATASSQRAVLRRGRRRHGGDFGPDARRRCRLAGRHCEQRPVTARTALIPPASRSDRAHGHQRDRLVGQCPVDRWPDLHGQRPHHHLQGRRRLPARAALPAGSGVHRQHRHRRQRQLYRLPRHQPPRPLGTVGDLLTAIDLASGVQ